MHFREQLKAIQYYFVGLDLWILKLYYKFIYIPKPNSLIKKLNQLTKNKKSYYFLQIGGNDGFINDPIFKFVKKYGGKGIIVEPQKKVFSKRLKRTYRLEKNLVLENVAIAQKTGKRKLYKIAVSDSRWATGLATFEKSVLEK